MGYTNYWENLGHKDDATNFLKVVEEAKKLYDNLPEHSESAGGYHSADPLKLCGWDGTGEPVFTETEISFNGDATLGLDHESFRVTPNTSKFDFCKTARKPYDLMVCAVLISMKKHLVTFSYSSDGNSDDWKPAKAFYKSVIKK